MNYSDSYRPQYVDTSLRKDGFIDYSPSIMIPVQPSPGMHELYAQAAQCFYRPYYDASVALAGVQVLPVYFNSAEGYAPFPVPQTVMNAAVYQPFVPAGYTNPFVATTVLPYEPWKQIVPVEL